MHILDELLRDMRHAGRSAWRHRGFAAATIATPSVVPGLAAGLAIAPSLRGRLFGVRPLHAVTFTTAPAMLVLVAAAASALAARRALRPRRTKSWPP
jgi:hypothetical protein